MFSGSGSGTADAFSTATIGAANITGADFGRELALTGHDGLESANANLMGEVALSWDEEKTSKDEIVAALRRSGFPEIEPERE